MPRVNPEILRWARESAGLTLAEAARSIGLKSDSGPERLNDLESGKRDPSRSTLVKMARQYRRPLLVFYQAARPTQGLRGEDFRTLPPDQRSEGADALLDALVRDVRVRQSMVRSVLADDPDSRKLEFIGSMKRSGGVVAVSNSIRRTIGIDVGEFRSADNVEKAFAYLRKKAEDAGIFVLLVGNLGSHHTALDVETFRGFALADDLAPFIVINDQDARSAWSFTLLHEMAHLWLGQTGVSGAYGTSAIERFCNDVASRLLVSDQELKGLDFSTDTTTSQKVSLIKEFATDNNVSAALVAYRAFRADILQGNDWVTIRDYLRKQWNEEKVDQKARNKRSAGGPNYFVVKKHRVGSALIDFVRRTVAGGELTTVKAGRVLGVRPKNVQPLLAEVKRSRSAA